MDKNLNLIPKIIIALYVDYFLVRSTRVGSLYVCKT